MTTQISLADFLSSIFNTGLDASPIDSNSGHGTHIAVTVLSDGSVDASTTGVAREANLVMYARLNTTLRDIFWSSRLNLRFVRRC